MATLNEAQTALANGDKATAFQLIDQVLTQTPTAEGWTFAAQIVDAQADKIKCLSQALALNPNYEPARVMYAALGETPPPVTSVPDEDESGDSGKYGLPPLNLPSHEQNEDTDKVRREGGKIIRQDGVYEMLWDCKFCGTKKLLGKSQKFCPVCGAQQDAEWRYYPSDSEKVAVQDHKYVGADKICPNCSSLNTADAEFCTRCGAPQSAAAAVKAQNARAANAVATGALGIADTGTPAAAYLTEDLDARQMAEKYGKKVTEAVSTRPKWLPYAIGAVVLAAAAFALFAIFAKKEASGYVTGFEWERTIQIERNTAFSESQICPAPPGAYNRTSRREQIDTRQVADGETCSSRQVDQGDGTFRQERVCETRYRSEPVYGDVCYYSINRWVSSRTANASGTKDNTPVWPSTNVNGCGSLGCEREGTRNESYTIKLSGDNDRTYECDLPFETWQATRIETVFTFKVRIVGGGIDCSTLTASAS